MGELQQAAVRLLIFYCFFCVLDVCLLIFAVRILIRPTTVFPLDRSFEACFCAARIKSCSHPQNWKTQTKMCKDMRELQVDFPPVDFPVVRTRHFFHVTPAPKPSPASRLPALGRIKWKGPSLPENYMPPGGISKGLVKTARPRQESEELVAQWRWQDANASFPWLVVSRSCFFLVFQTCWRVIKLGWHG